MISFIRHVRRGRADGKSIVKVMTLKISRNNEGDFVPDWVVRTMTVMVGVYNGIVRSIDSILLQLQ